VVGIAVASSLLATGRVPRGTGALGADLRVMTLADPRLDLSPVGLVLSAAGLKPGDEANGDRSTLNVRNVTGGRLRVRLGARVEGRELADILWLEVREVGTATTIFRGPIAQLGTLGSSAFTLESGKPTDLIFTTWLPASVTRDFEGRESEVDLQWDEVAT
jgi:hypothetical protein